MGEAKQQYQVLFHHCPVWLVGEHQEVAVARRVLVHVASPSNRHPDDFAGRVISIKRLTHVWTAKDVEDPSRALVTLDLTMDEVIGLRARRLKLDASLRLVAVTFEDRYGATADSLRAEYGSLTLGQVKQLSEETQQAFEQRVVDLRRALPKTITNTGAGLYEVGPGKTYSTIQSALDQLWADQGSTIFSASQYIRVFADTYDEADIWPNDALNTDETNGYTLIIEGDPGTSRDNVIVQPTSGSWMFYFSMDTIVLRHMTIDASAINEHAVWIFSGCNNAVVADCVIESGNLGDFAVFSSRSVLIEDCVITAVGQGIYTANVSGVGVVRRCRVVKSGVQQWLGVRLTRGGVIESTVISGFDTAVYTNAGYLCGSTVLNNNTIYDCAKVVDVLSSAHYNLVLINNIFDEVDYVLTVTCWPDETTENEYGGRYRLRNNCWQFNTAFAYDGSATKTHAQFAAFDGADSNANLDTDPLLTNPGSGDFSLQGGSPCRNAGHGSGVPTDYLGTDFDPNEPDIGAWSSGPAPGDGGGQQTRFLLEEA